MSARPQPPQSGALIELLPASLQPLARRGVLRRYRKGEVVIEEGETGDTLLIVLAGSLRAYAADNRGREITYGIYGPGEYLGEMSLDGGPRSASVDALQATQCAVVTRSTLLAHIADQPEFALELVGKLIRRARAATLSARQLALNDVYGRLAALLDAESAANSSAGLRTMPQLTHREMAARLGCSREMVSRLFKDLERGGYVKVAAGQFQLLKALPAKW